MPSSAPQAARHSGAHNEIMEPISKTLRKKAAKENKNIHSETHFWADLISRSFGERHKFGMYLGIVKRIGLPESKRLFAEIRQSDCRNPGKLFLWKSKKENFQKNA